MYVGPSGAARDGLPGRVEVLFWVYGRGCGVAGLKFRTLGFRVPGFRV